MYEIPLMNEVCSKSEGAMMMEGWNGCLLSMFISRFLFFLKAWNKVQNSLFDQI